MLMLSISNFISLFLTPSMSLTVSLNLIIINIANNW